MFKDLVVLVSLMVPCYLKTLCLLQIFRKEPFFHGHDNYDQVSVPNLWSCFLSLKYSILSSISVTFTRWTLFLLPKVLVSFFLTKKSWRKSQTTCTKVVHLCSVWCKIGVTFFWLLLVNWFLVLKHYIKSATNFLYSRCTHITVDPILSYIIRLMWCHFLYFSLSESPK